MNYKFLQCVPEEDFLKWCFTYHLVPEYLIYFLISFLTPCTTQQWVVLAPWVWVFTRDLFVVNFKLYFLVFRWDTCVREYGLIWSCFCVLLRRIFILWCLCGLFGWCLFQSISCIISFNADVSLLIFLLRCPLYWRK